jgi:hypothetical protein
MKRISLVAAVLFLFVAAAGACEKAKAGDHQAQMKALLAKVDASWNQVLSATTPAAKDVALRAHGEAWGELKAAHEKYVAAASPEKKMDCKEMMAKKKAASEEKMEGCKDHKKASTEAHTDHSKGQ